jgi:C1A family cysteine protease
MSYAHSGKLVSLLMLVSGAINFVPISALSDTLPQIPPDLPSQYKDRETNAPLAIRNDLDALRQRAGRHNWSFQVGYTAVFDQDLAGLAGTQIPTNFLAMATAQHEYALRVAGVTRESARLAGVPSQVYLQGCDPGAKAFNWRNLSKVTPIKNQRSCGSCWAFSAAESFEDAYLARTGKQIILAPQQLLDCSGVGDCKGGWYYDAFQYLQTHGGASEGDAPYTGQAGTCNAVLPIRYRAVNWDFVSVKDEIPLPSEIKRAICAYGPVSSAIAASVAFTAYVSGVFNEQVGDPINHAVTIVGWDDNKDAWLIRNDWDVLWGDQGFGWVDYKTAQIGYAAAWVQPADDTLPISPGPLAAAYDISKESIAGAVATVAAEPSNSARFDSRRDKNLTQSFNDSYVSQVAKTYPVKGPLIFIQYSDDDQFEAVEETAYKLRRLGYFVATRHDAFGSKIVDESPDSPEVRYYRDEDLPNAERVAEVLTEFLGQVATTRRDNLVVHGSPIVVRFPKVVGGR